MRLFVGVDVPGTDRTGRNRISTQRGIDISAADKVLLSSVSSVRASSCVLVCPGLLRLCTCSWDLSGEGQGVDELVCEQTDVQCMH